MILVTELASDRVRVLTGVQVHLRAGTLNHYAIFIELLVIIITAAC